MNVKKRQRQTSEQHEEKAAAPAAIPNVCCQPVVRGTAIGTAIGTVLEALDTMAFELKACANLADIVACKIAGVEDRKGRHAADEACWGRLKQKVNEARPTPLAVLKDLPCQSHHNKAAFAAGAAGDTARYVLKKVNTMINLYYAGINIVADQPISKIELKDATEVMEAAEYVWQWAVIAGTAPECQSVVDKAAATWALARVVRAWVREQSGTPEDDDEAIVLSDRVPTYMVHGIKCNLQCSSKESAFVSACCRVVWSRTSKVVAGQDVFVVDLPTAESTQAIPVYGVVERQVGESVYIKFAGSGIFEYQNFMIDTSRYAAVLRALESDPGIRHISEHPNVMQWSAARSGMRPFMERRAQINKAEHHAPDELKPTVEP
jgi:hypothetical protein